MSTAAQIRNELLVIRLRLELARELLPAEPERAMAFLAAAYGGVDELLAATEGSA